MSSIPQNYCDENELIDCVQRFFSRHHVGKLLAKCNGMKEKGVSPVSLLRYKLSNIFVGRSMYMQRRTGSFKEEFSKNTFYRFLNSAKTNSDKSAGSNDDPVGHCPQCRTESGLCSV